MRRTYTTVRRNDVGCSVTPTTWPQIAFFNRLLGKVRVTSAPNPSREKKTAPNEEDTVSH